MLDHYNNYILILKVSRNLIQYYYRSSSTRKLHYKIHMHQPRGQTYNLYTFRGSPHTLAKLAICQYLSLWPLVPAGLSSPSLPYFPIYTACFYRSPLDQSVISWEMATWFCKLREPMILYYIHQYNILHQMLTMSISR